MAGRGDSEATDWTAFHPLLQLIQWLVIPPLASSILLRCLYAIRPVSRPVFQHQSQAAESRRRQLLHSRNARALVVGTYLLYTIVQAYRQQATATELNAYACLGLSVDALGPSDFASYGVSPGSIHIPLPVPGRLDSMALKAHWKRLAKAYHPDKLSYPAGVDRALHRSQAQDKFIRMRESYEVLSQPMLRWAYDRFGPEIQNWKRVQSPRAYMWKGLAMRGPKYFQAAMGLTVLKVIRSSEPGYVWRWVILISMASLELGVLMGPSSEASSYLRLVFPNRVLFEHVSMLHSIAFASTIAIGQIVPLFFPGTPTFEDEVFLWTMALQRQNQDLNELALELDVEIKRQSDEDLVPLLIDGSTGDTNSKEEIVRTLEMIREKMRDDNLNVCGRDMSCISKGTLDDLLEKHARCLFGAADKVLVDETSG